jgi:hypothetical protein
MHPTAEIIIKQSGIQPFTDDTANMEIIAGFHVGINSYSLSGF